MNYMIIAFFKWHKMKSHCILLHLVHLKSKIMLHFRNAFCYQVGRNDNRPTVHMGLSFAWGGHTELILCWPQYSYQIYTFFFSFLQNVVYHLTVSFDMYVVISFLTLSIFTGHNELINKCSLSWDIFYNTCKCYRNTK